MENSTITALIAGGTAVSVALIGKATWWAKKPDTTSEMGAPIAAQTGDVSESLVAVGTNITQHQGPVHNHYTGGPGLTGPKVATRPSMVEIADAIIAAKPYDRTQIPKNYVGIPVCWPVVFAGLSQYQDEKWCVSFDSRDARYRSVEAFIDISRYPQLKVLDWGHPDSYAIWI